MNAFHALEQHTNQSVEEFAEKIVNIDKEKLSKEELHHAYNLLLKHKHIFTSMSIN